MIDSDLEDILRAWWHQDRDDATSDLGYPSTCPSCRGYRSDDDPIDQLDSRRAVHEAVEHALQLLTDEQRVCIGVMARNLTSGSHVWKSPRLPADADRIAVLQRDSLEALRKALERMYIPA